MFSFFIAKQLCSHFQLNIRTKGHQTTITIIIIIAVVFVVVSIITNISIIHITSTQCY